MSVIVKMAGALEPYELDQYFDDTVLTIGQIKQGGNALVIGRDVQGNRIAINVDRILSIHGVSDDDEEME